MSWKGVLLEKNNYKYFLSTNGNGDVEIKVFIILPVDGWGIVRPAEVDEVLVGWRLPWEQRRIEARWRSFPLTISISANVSSRRQRHELKKEPSNSIK